MPKTKSMGFMTKTGHKAAKLPAPEFVTRDGVLYASAYIKVDGLGVVRTEKPHQQELSETVRLKIFNFLTTGKSNRNAPPGYYADSYPMDAETQELERLGGLINQLEG
jgi:hypothetical protein